MRKTETALSLFEKGFNCSQSVLCAFGMESGLDQETCLRFAGSFGGGMARRAETCGAVTGALMVLGLRYGMVNEGDFQARKINYEEAGKFMDAFKQLNGSILCRDLLGFDLSTPEGSRRVADKKLTSTLCPRFVQSAVELLEKR